MTAVLNNNSQTISYGNNFQQVDQQERINPFKQLKTKLIKEIAKKSLLELAIALLFTGAACFFVATPIGMATLLTASVVAVAINILLRSTCAYLKYRICQLSMDPSFAMRRKKELMEKVLKVLNYFMPITFATVVDTHTRDLLVHEGGHALAASLLIKNSGARVSITPHQGGSTSYRLGALTNIGEFFGRAKSKLIIAAAGPALAVVTSTVGLGISLAVRKSHPELSRYLKVSAIVSIAEHALYALSAFWTSATQKGHDFLQLMAGGVHPAVSVVSIIALPIIVRLGFLIYDKIKAKIAEKRQEK